MKEQMINRIFAVREKQLREEFEMTQRELAEKLGVSRACVANWENGLRMPSDSVIEKITVQFGVSADYLFGRTDIRYRINVPSSRALDLSKLNSLGMSRIIEYYNLLTADERFTEESNKN